MSELTRVPPLSGGKYKEHVLSGYKCQLKKRCTLLSGAPLSGDYCTVGIEGLKSTGRDRSWTGEYTACGRCHLAHAA